MKILVAMAVAATLALPVAAAEVPKEASKQLSKEAPKDDSSIGYPDVVTALLEVQKKADTRAEVQDGWTIAQTKEDGKTVLWSFTQKWHPAHPSAVKRTLVLKDGTWDIDMKVLCEAPRKVECDKLKAEFKRLNEEMVKSLQRQR